MNKSPNSLIIIFWMQTGWHQCRLAVSKEIPVVTGVGCNAAKGGLVNCILITPHTTYLHNGLIKHPAWIQSPCGNRKLGVMRSRMQSQAERRCNDEEESKRKTHSKEKTMRDQTWIERLSKQRSASEVCSGCQREWEERKTMETFIRDCERWSRAHMLGKLLKHSENCNLKWDLPLTQASTIDCALQGNTTDFFLFLLPSLLPMYDLCLIFRRQSM